MGKNTNRGKSARNVIDVGAKMVEDYKAIQARLAEGHHQVQVKKGPVGELSKYAAKQRAKRNDAWVPPVSSVQESDSQNDLEKSVVNSESQAKNPINFVRQAVYVFLPNEQFEKPKQKFGLTILNYVFPDGSGYRYAFSPQNFRKISEFETFTAVRSYCHKLPKPITIDRSMSLYLNECNEIVLGDKYDPRLHDLTLVEKLKTGK